MRRSRLWPHHINHSADVARAYGAAIGTVALALLLSLALRPIADPNPFLFFFAAIAFSAYYGGLGPGLLATALSILAVNYTFVPPTQSFKVDVLDAVRLGVFALVAALISGFSEARWRTQRAAETQRQHIQVTLASIGDAVITTDEQGQVTFLNAVAETLTGWSLADAQGQPIEVVFRAINVDTRAPVESPVARVLREGMVVGLANHTVLLARDGAEHAIDDSGAPILDTDGRLIGVVLVFRDITAREHAERAREQLLAREQAARVAAERAREQLAFLAEAGAVLSRSLDYPTTLREVAALAVPRMSDWCAVDVLRPDGQLQRVAVVHADPGKIALVEELYERYPPDRAADGPWQVIRTGQPLALPEVADDLLVAYSQDAGHLALLRTVGMGAVIIVPLLAGEIVLGAMTLVMAESGRRYGDDDLAVALSLGRRAGLAVEKAQLYVAEQRARAAAEQLADRLARLQTVTGALAAASQPEDVARVTTEQVVQALGARACAVLAYDPASRTLQLLHATGYGAAFQGWERFSVDGPYPFSEVVRAQTPLYFSARAAFNARYPAFATAPTITEAVAYLPLLVDDRAIGGLSIGFATARELDADERAFLEALAGQCAQALDRASLLRAEQRARERLAFLAEVSAQLVASLDYTETLEQIARLVVPRLADWCALEVPTADGELKLELIAHVDPAKEQWARELRERYPGRMDMPVGSPLVIRSGKPLLYPDITDEIIQQAAHDAEELRLLRLVGYRSMIVVPLRVHDRIIGALGLISTADSGRHYTPDDMTLAEELARRAAMALENATLYRAAEEARTQAEQVAEQTAQLQHVTAALGTATTIEQVAAVVVHESLDVLAADAGAIYTLTDEGTMLQALSFRGYPAELVPRHVRVPADAPGPLADALATRELVLVETAEALVERWPNLRAAQEQSADAAVVAVPLLLNQEVLGVLYAAFRTSRRFSDVDRAFLAALGRQCVQALERAQLYAAEQAARATAEAALKQRDLFLSVAAHELKTPLTTLMGQAQLLERRLRRAGQFVAPYADSVTTVVGQAGRLNRMIAALLDVSRIERGQLTLERAPIDLCVLARRVVAELQPTAEAHDITSVGPEDGLIVDGDELRLEQVLQNLVQNAIKYSPGGGPVTVAVEGREGQVCVSVTDQGIGIPEEALPQLFQRFYRAPDAQRRQISGMGIGLYVVREIVRLHDGSVVAERTAVGGSRFTVFLPRAPLVGGRACGAGGCPTP